MALPSATPVEEPTVIYEYNAGELHATDDLWPNWERDPSINGQRRVKFAHYIISPLPHPGRIRLLHLQPGHGSDPISISLNIAVLGDYLLLVQNDPGYEALSYTWGDPEKTHQIFCDGKTMRVNRNVHAALTALRDPLVPRTLWVDAICINQDDNAEKSDQVQLMGEIYARANRVIVWLGEEDERDAHAIQAIAAVYNYIESQKPSRGESWDMTVDEIQGVPGFPDDGWHHLGFFLSRPWFHRMWVLQEVVKAQRAVCILGTESLPYEHLTTVVRRFTRAGLRHDSRSLPVAGGRGVFSTMLVYQWHRNGATFSARNDHCYFDLLFSAGSLSATDPRDKLYALLDISIHEDEWLPLPNYALPPLQVFRDFAILDMTRNKSMRSLCWAYLLEPGEQPQPGHPSWTPDFSRTCFPTIGYRNLFHKCRAGGGLPVVAELEDDNTILVLRGRTVGTVQRLCKSRNQHCLDAGVDLFAGPGTYSAAAIKAESNWTDDCHWAMNGVRLDGMRMRTDSILLTGRTSDSYANFIRALCCGVNMATMEPLNEKTISAIEIQLVELKGFAEGWMRDEDVWDEDTVYRRCVGDLTTGHMRFCYLGNGQMGWVPGGAEVGDVVFVFDGGAGPNVLRGPSEDGTYLWVGEGWVQGVMDGELVEQVGSESERVRIR
ncbi:hypothetical protein OQA88_5423 [Cercophora sp. LCS_1]